MKGPSESALLTDLYQLTMLQAYWQHRMDDSAVFELFVRTLPPDRAFPVATGLEQALDFIEQARFDLAGDQGARRRRRSPPGQRPGGPCCLT